MGLIFRVPCTKSSALPHNPFFSFDHFCFINIHNIYDTLYNLCLPI